MTNIFEAPKATQTNIEVEQTRMYHGEQGYKKKCIITSIQRNNRVTFTIDGDPYEMPIRTIGELCG